MKQALLILHQKRSKPGDIGDKLIKRGFSLDIRRPCQGDVLPNNLDDHSLVVIFGGPMSVNDSSDFIKYEMQWLKIVLSSEWLLYKFTLKVMDLSLYSKTNISRALIKFDDK